MTRATNFLNEQLAPDPNGMCASGNIRNAGTLCKIAKRKRISDRALRRAATTLGIVRFWEEGQVVWAHPTCFSGSALKAIHKVGLSNYLNRSRKI